MLVLLLEQKTPASAPVLEFSIEDIDKNLYMVIVYTRNWFMPYRIVFQVMRLRLWTRSLKVQS
ncbi:MAG: hypothetical protein QOJ51_2716 [Acidobacteriaceae bacterium]|nr:hypothetical protein [Acidobacteriaceae bacterium]